jgi:hypothetical protein
LEERGLVKDVAPQPHDERGQCENDEHDADNDDDDDQPGHGMEGFRGPDR